MDSLISFSFFNRSRASRLFKLPPSAQHYLFTHDISTVQLPRALIDESIRVRMSDGKKQIIRWRRLLFLPLSRPLPYCFLLENAQESQSHQMRRVPRLYEPCPALSAL